MRDLRRLAFWLLVAMVLSGCPWQEDEALNGLLAWDRIELIAELDEPILRLEAQAGEWLQPGDPILQQDDRTLKARLAEAQGALDQARARLAELRRGPRPERIEAARARLAGIRAEAENAARELQRLQKLQPRRLASEEAVDAAHTRRSASRAAVEVAGAELNELLHGSTREELQQAEALVAQAVARVEQLQLTLERLQLVAPGPGRLDELLFEVGERPPAGKVVAVLLAGAAPYARVYVPEPMRAGLQVGSEALVRVDGIDGVFEGRIRHISSEASFTPFYSLTERDRSRLSYVAEIELGGDSAAALPAGLPVRVTFRTPQP